MTILYNLLLHPKITVLGYLEKNALLPMSILVALATVSTSQIVQTPQSFLLCLLFTSFIHIAITMLFSCTTDFIAQWYGAEGQTMSLFYKLSLAQTPLLLGAPLFLLHAILPKFVLSLGTFVLTLYCFHIAFSAIQTTYDLSVKKTWLILFTPILLILAFFFTGLIIVFLAY